MEIQKNSIKQPSPSVEKSGETPKRKYKTPRVGVVDVPYISATPIQDTLALQKKENPHIVYKLTPRRKVNFQINTILSTGVVGCGLCSLISVIRKIKKK